MKDIGSMEAGGAVHSREDALLERHEKPINPWEQQVLLAVDLYERDRGKVKVFDHATKETLMEYWNNHGYGDVFRDLLEHPDFKTRFNDDALSVTLADVEYFMKHRNMSDKIPPA